MGHSPDALQGAQDAGARVFDCMLREADELLEEAQAEWFCAADRPEAALEGLRAAGFLAAVGVWLASMRGDPQQARTARPGLSPILPPPRAKDAPEDPALERLRAIGARAARLYDRALRLDGLLSGREDSVATPPPAPAASAPVRKRRRAATPSGPAGLGPSGQIRAFPAAPGAGTEGHPDARGRQIWLSEALAAEALG